MKVSELISTLTDTLEVDGDLEVEVATCERKDEWYEIADVIHDTNHRGEPVFVINTD